MMLIPKYFSFKNSFIIVVLLTSLFACNKDKKEAELALIFSYIEENEIVVDTLPSGLLFAQTGFSTPETLESDLPAKGNTVVSVYKAYILISGTPKNKLTLFNEATIEDPNYYTYKEDPVIQGWEEAIGLMKKGTSAIVIIPSKLAYGSDQVGIIPPYTPLVFNIRIYDINK